MSGLVGFQLKGTSKRQKLVQDVANEPPALDIVLSISNGASISLTSNDSVMPLVIPLCQKQNVSENKSLDLNKLAEEELIAELNAYEPNSSNNTLVIEQSTKQTDFVKRKPLLMQNVNPLLKSSETDDDRFKSDMEHRADDMNFKSDIYDTVPVSQFGAALLRGMGWDGNATEAKDKKFQDTDKIIPRENRLGLGAMARPPSMSTAKHRPAKDKPNKDALSSDWQKKVESRLKNQKLKVGDLVWLRDLRLLDRRAQVTAASGVPGLDRIRVQLEVGGELAEVSRKDAVLLNAEELSRRPYSQAAQTVAGPVVEASPRFFGVSDHQPEVASKVTGALQSCGAVTFARKASGEKPKVSHASVGWLLAGIRVKVVSRSLGGGAYHRQKGVVLDVFAKGVACVRLDSGAVVSEARESQLETILPQSGQRCVVLLGERKGEDAVLRDTNPEDHSALVEFCEDLELQWLSMDSVAAYGR